MKIIQANKQNISELILFRLLLLKHTSKIDSKVKYSKEKIQKSLKYMKEYLNKKDNAYFLAYNNSLPIGYLHVTHDNKKDKESSYISELYILDLYRNKGVGKKLISYQLKYLKKKGIKKNILTTTKNKNKYIINFYKKLDYSIIKEDKYKNIIYLSREIR